MQNSFINFILSIKCHAKTICCPRPDLCLNNRRLCHAYSSRKHAQTLSSYDAVKQMKHLQRQPNQANMITKAFEIYNNLDEGQQNEFVSNALLNCCKQMLKHCKTDLSHTTKVIHHISNKITNNNSENNFYAKTSLISVYSQCRDVTKALEIFKAIPPNQKDIVCVSAMLKCFIENEQSNQALRLYDTYANVIGRNNDVCNLLFIKACIGSDNCERAKELIDSQNMSDKTHINSHSIEFLTCLIDFYGINGNVCKAWHIFENVSPKNKLNIICINAMMACLIGNNECNKAILLFEEYYYRKSGNGNGNIRCNEVSHLLLIKACANNGEYEKGMKYIDSILQNKTEQNIKRHSTEFLTCLIDFYGKCKDIHCTAYF